MHARLELWNCSYQAIQVVMQEVLELDISEVIIEFDDINIYGATECTIRSGWRCGSKVEMSENMKVIRCGNKRLLYCWREK